jgi:hypothetical protein
MKALDSESCRPRLGMGRILCDLGLMNLVYDDLASLILDGHAAARQLRASLCLRGARIPAEARRRTLRICDAVCQSLPSFLEMPRECFDESMACMGGDRAELLWWLRAMDEGHRRDFPALRGQKADPWVEEECAKLVSRLRGGFESLALGRGQFRDSTKLSMALCACALVESGDDGADLALDLHKAARAATCWMSTERLRRRLRLPRRALPSYAASLVLAASWYRGKGLGADLMLFVQKRQLRRFDKPEPALAGRASCREGGADPAE